MMPEFLTIGRLGDRAGVEPKTLRYYDRVGLVRPARRTEAGYRVYDPGALDRLRFIRRAKTLGMSLADIRRVLAVRDEGAAPCRHVRDLVAKNLTAVETQIQHLETLRADLRRLRRALTQQVPLDAPSAAECHCFALIEGFAKTKAGSPRARRVRALSRGHA